MYSNTTYASASVQHHHLILEEFECICIYIPGKKKILVDILLYVKYKSSNKETYYKEYLYLKTIYEDTIQVLNKLQVIEEHQQKVKTELNYYKKEKRGDITLYITNNNCIIVPKSLQNELIEQYYIILKHPGDNCVYFVDTL